MSDPIVSIISPTYNHEKYILDCIESAKCQTFTHWEMIIVSDGSTDNTLAAARRAAGNDPRIRIVDQPNVGIFRLAETYNKALSAAKGRYIGILEGDDLLEPNKLERQVKVLDNTPNAVMSWGSAYQVDEKNHQIFNTYPSVTDSQSSLYNNTPKGSMLDILFYRNPITALTMLIRKEALEKIGGFQQGYNLPTVDIPTIQMLSTVGEFVFDSQVLGRWRVYPNQTTKVHIASMFEGYYQLSKNNIANFSQDQSLHFSVTQSQLKQYFDKLMISVYSRAGRYKLIRGLYADARKDYIKSLTLPGGQLMWRLRSLVGFIFSLLHLNVESLARVLNRPSYKG